MKFPITYNKDSMTLGIKLGKYSKYLQCPFATWWKARKYFKKPQFKWYFGPTCKVYGMKHSKFGDYLDYTEKGIWPMASTEYLKWCTPKWFPIHIMSWDISWKDKFDDPRFEHNGYFAIFFGRDFYKCWQLSLQIKAPEIYCNNDCTSIDNEENYWESMLWYLYYSHDYNETVDINTKKGTRTYQNINLDLYKARKSRRIYHWSKTKYTDINDCDTIINHGYEHIDGGNKDISMFFVDVQSDELTDVANKTYNHYNGRIIRSDFNVRINIDTPNNEIKSVSYITDLVQPLKDTNIVRLYFKNTDTLSTIFVCKQYDKIQLTYVKYIDLGPSFKDEFLNKRGIKLIREHNKK